MKLYRTKPNSRVKYSRLPLERVHNLLYLRALGWLQEDIKDNLLSTIVYNTEFNCSWYQSVIKNRKAIIRKYSVNTLRIGRCLTV